MTNYLPPTNNDPIFNPTNFKSKEEELMTVSEANKKYLTYPYAQGTENLQAINVGGVATFLSDSVFDTGNVLIDAYGASTFTCNKPTTINASTTLTGDITTTTGNILLNSSNPSTTFICNKPSTINNSLTIAGTITSNGNVSYNNTGGSATFTNNKITTFNKPFTVNDTFTTNTGDVIFNANGTTTFSCDKPTTINNTLTANNTTTINNSATNSVIPNMVLTNTSTSKSMIFNTSPSTGLYSLASVAGRPSIVFNNPSTIMATGTTNTSIQVNPTNITLWGGGTVASTPTTYIQTNGTSNVLSTTTGSTTVISNGGAGTTQALAVKDGVSNKGIIFVPNTTNGIYDPMVVADLSAILSQSSDILIGSWTGVSNGLLSGNTHTLIGYGGVNNIPTSYADFIGTTINIAPSLTYPDTSVQSSAYTGAKALAGSYTNANMTIDTNGKISAISNGAANQSIPMAYQYFNNYVGTAPPVITFTTSGANWGINEFFTVRFQITTIFSTVSGAAPSVNTQSGYMDFYPNRFSTSLDNANTIALMNGTIDGNANYVITPYIYQPYGRMYWTYDYNSTGSFAPIYVCSNTLVDKNSIGIIVRNPNATTSEPFTMSSSFTIVNKGNQTYPITVSNASGTYGL